MHRPRPRPRPGWALAALLLVLATAGLAAGPAAADPVDDARRQAAAAAAAVHDLRPAVLAAERAYDEAVQRLDVSATASLGADGQADAARVVRRAAESARRARVRALYMSGGQAALYDGVLRSGPGDLLGRIASVQRVVSVGQRRVEQARAESARVDRAAQDAAARTGASMGTVREVEARSAELDLLLVRAATRLDGLSARAAGLETARRARAELEAARAEAERTLAVRAAAARPRLAPAAYEALYVGAAATCPGLPWQVLSAIGQVESGHGSNTATSYAGAQGPMQFLPSTFARYAVDGDGDGLADIASPADAIYTAARYLCANGGGSPSGLPGALWHYNHAQWYVDLVLGIARQLDPSIAAGLPTAALPGPGRPTAVRTAAPVVPTPAATAPPAPPAGTPGPSTARPPAATGSTPAVGVPTPSTAAPAASPGPVLPPTPGPTAAPTAAATAAPTAAPPLVPSSALTSLPAPTG